MTDNQRLTFKVATEQWELDLIHKLNYETFVNEIPQHEPNEREELVDKFHAENTYIICRTADDLVGMVAVRGERPFSLDNKLDNLDSYLPPSRRVCEIRLLSVRQKHRQGRVMAGLATMLLRYCLSRGFDLAVISGTVRQIRLYKHLGFEAFGPKVGTEEAQYQPMMLGVERLKEKTKQFEGLMPLPVLAETQVNLLPGPVNLREPVRAAFGEMPVSHRAHAFVRDFNDIKQRLCNLLGAAHCEMMMGSGTCANDAVGGQLSLLKSKGLVLSNGEFGDRLIDHATRWGLDADTLRIEWGKVFDFDSIVAKLDADPSIDWVWMTHNETSSGILNPLERLGKLCDERGIKLVVDCISSIGTVPVDLSHVYLASCVSGKAISSFSGIAMIFYNHEIRPAPKSLPRYLDLGYYAQNDGIAFTMSSNLVYALGAAVSDLETRDAFGAQRELSDYLRGRIREMGIDIVAPDEHASPAVITMALPAFMDSKAVGEQLEDEGYLLSYRSEYLVRRNWIQICMMGDVRKEQMEPLLQTLQLHCTLPTEDGAGGAAALRAS